MLLLYFRKNNRSSVLVTTELNLIKVCVQKIVWKPHLARDHCHCNLTIIIIISVSNGDMHRKCYHATYQPWQDSPSNIAGRQWHDTIAKSKQINSQPHNTTYLEHANFSITKRQQKQRVITNKRRVFFDLRQPDDALH